MEISIMGAICFASLYEPVHQRFSTNIDFGRIANIQPQAFGKAVAWLVEERVDEQNHKLRIERIAKVVNSTSLKVTAQYETALYPIGNEPTRRRTAPRLGGLFQTGSASLHGSPV